MSNPSDGDEPFLSRWSRRKRGAVSGPVVDDLAAADAATLAAREGQAIDQAGKDEIDLSKLPEVEGLDVHSDITGFLDMRVPAVLRNAALARMWTLDPTIRDFIEVAENQWNWNIPGGAPFYEEIVGSPEIAESIVQGGGSVLRKVLEVDQVEVKADTLVEYSGATDSASRNVEALGKADGAVRNAQINELDGASAEIGCLSPILQAEVAGAPRDAASQYPGIESEAQPMVRRRHGGALPV
jgi:hypothetical protein